MECHTDIPGPTMQVNDSIIIIIIIIIIFHSVCNLNGYDSRNITITFFPNLFQRLSIQDLRRHRSGKRGHS
jgi:hypothetical protein